MYLDARIRKGFENYKYNSLDTSPFANYVMHPFWNQFVKLLPLWLAPNLMTLTGFLLLVVNFALLSYYDFHFDASNWGEKDAPTVPHWLWLVCAFNNFMAHTLDGADGKQARRTGTGSALGELFDHGLDSWATFFLTIAMYDMFGRGAFGTTPWRMLLIFLSVLVVFACSHWEKYNTRVLFLPWGYDVAQVSMTAMYLVTYVFTESVWKINIPQLGITFGNICEVTMYASCLLFSLPMCIWNVYVSYRDRTGNMLSPWESMRPLVPFSVLFLVIILWAQLSPSRILESEPRAFYFMLGAVFSNIACRLIVSQMSSTRCDSFNYLLLPVAMAMSISVLPAAPLVDETVLLYALTVFVTAAHLHYGYHVIIEMADNLNIYVFSVEKVEKRSS